MARPPNVAISIVLLYVTYLMTSCQCANVLFFQPYASMSHTVSVMPALEGLAIRGGHNVTFLGMFVPKSKTVINVLALKAAHDWYAIENPNMASFRSMDLTFVNYFMNVLPSGLCRVVLNDPNFLRVVADKDTKYDVVIVDPLMSECGMSLIWLLGNPPLIYYCTTSLYSIYALSLDIPTPLSYVPMNFMPFSDRMTFVQRLINFLAHAFVMAHRNYVQFPAMEAIVRQTYPDVPSLADIERNASFVFSNSYSPALDFPRPMASYFAEVGGIHCRPAKPLSKNLEDFIQGAGENGFVYFSLGSNIKGTHLSLATIGIFLKAFGRLKQRVIWKFEDKLDGLPANVRVYKWLSQQDVLGHPNIKVFITQGGQLSTQEAIYHGAPILGMPFIGEQVANVGNMVSKGMGEELDYENLNEDMVYDMLAKISNNSSYKENCRRQSKLMQDRPMEAIDTIVYWVGYVVRHRGAHHMRLNGAGLNLYQYFMLDVIAVIFITLTVTIFVLVKVLGLIVRGVSGKSNSSTKSDVRGIAKKMQ